MQGERYIPRKACAAKVAKETTVGTLTLKHVEAFENEIKQANIETDLVSPKLLPDYTRKVNG